MGSTDSFERWRPELIELCGEIRRRTRALLEEARSAGDPARAARQAGVGSGDVTFALDLPAEQFLERWLRERSLESPLSLLTEDKGWRHAPGEAPGDDSGDRPGGFGHGGPRIAVDPVDGTRNLMAELRSAWTVVSFAPHGAAQPRLRELSGGIVAEIPTLQAASYRVYWAQSGGPCRFEERSLEDDRLLHEGTLRADADDRVDRGYFPFFRYKPDLRPALAALEAAFFERLEKRERADLRSVYDDQYISSAGQMILLARGVYRMVVDARALVGSRRSRETVTSKPFDLAGAVICARAAGAVVTAADGSELDFPIDTKTPVDVAGYANEATRARLEPHWLAVVRSGSR